MERTIDLEGNRIVNNRKPNDLLNQILDILKSLSVSSFNERFCNNILVKQRDFLNDIKNSLNLINEHIFEDVGCEKNLEDKLKNLLDTFICLVDLRSNELST